MELKENKTNTQKSADIGHKNQGDWENITVKDAVGMVSLIVVVFGIGMAYVAHYWVNEHSASVKFFTEAMFSFLALIVILVQAGIYSQQRTVMKRQADYYEVTERAYIGIRRMQIVGLNEGFEQIAVQVTFRNGGKSPAFKFRPYAEVSVGDVPKPFTWREITPDIKRAFIPGGEDRSIVVPCFGLIDDPDTIFGQKPTKQVFIDGEARYESLGGKEIIFCFGGSYVVGEKLFESRYQYEREAEAEAEPN